MVRGTGCSNENRKLTECLKKTKKDWRMCKVRYNMFIGLEYIASIMLEKQKKILMLIKSRNDAGRKYKSILIFLFIQFWMIITPTKILLLLWLAS